MALNGPRANVTDASPIHAYPARVPGGPDQESRHDESPDPELEIGPVEVERVVAGGLGLARQGNGRVVLVDGALPGEIVRPVVERVRRDLVHATIRRIVVPSADRVEPPCPAVAAGCGGCDLQHAAVGAQPRLRQDIVRDALRRLGGLRDAVVRSGPPIAATGYRTTVRCLVVQGRPALRARASHDPVAIEQCLVAHPLIDELVRDGRFDGCGEVTLRAGARTGERLVVATPRADGVRVPDDAVVVGIDELRKGRTAAYHEDVAGRRWRISARSFFQPNPEGADALIAVAREQTADLLSEGGLIDLYGGVGLFAGCLGAVARAANRDIPIVLVERNRSAAGDARHNLADLGPGVTIRTMGLERWRPEPGVLVVADPAREGLGPVGVGAIAGTGAARAIVVSCDAAALGRDTRLLGAAGYDHVESVVVDQFGMTSHVEVVTRFDRV
jgi:23S rRNA (uracil1939-C5)-methyltransferase